jgi:hypothetical protein
MCQQSDEELSVRFLTHFLQQADVIELFLRKTLLAK